MGRNLELLKGERHKDDSFAVIDIETMNWTKFIVLGFYDGEKYLEFRKIKNLFNFLKEDDAPTTILAHFGGKFDFLFLLEEALKNEIEIESIIPRGSSILCLSLKINKRVYHFRDSAALLPFSLKSVTENFDTAVKKKDWDHTKTKGYSKELSAYLKDDCVSLYQAFKIYFDWPLIKKAGQAYTVAGQAMRVFRTFLKSELYNPGKHVNNLCRRAYFGGRTEIFNPMCKKGPIFEYDANSLYPYVMRENLYPTGRGVLTFRYKAGKLGIYDCEVTAPKIHIPVLGILHNKKYIFPVGKFKGHFTSAEIEYAKTKGYKIAIRSGIYFEKSEYLFKDFVNELYAIRLISEKNSVNDIIAKLLMNSLYGRFGMRLERENITFDLEKGVKEFRLLRVKNKNVQLYKKPVELESFIHVAIAAFVTSYARVHMHRLMSPLGEHLFYTDTDSIFTTKEMVTSKELGGLKHEGTYASAVFLLPKTYYALGSKKSKIAMKGFDRKKIHDFDLEDFHNALEGDLRKFKITNEPKFATLKQALAQNKIVSMTKKNEKQLKAVYDKRIIKKLKKGVFKTDPIILKG